MLQYCHPFNYCVSRVSSIKSRVSQLRTQLFGEVVQKLISKSYVEEGVTVTRRREYVTEIRPTDMNPTFQHVHECLSWVENKQVKNVMYNKIFIVSPLFKINKN